jgi:hypothetical protein
MKKKPTVPAAPAPPRHWSVEFGRSRGRLQRPFTPWLGSLPRFFLRGTRSHLRTREFSYDGRLKGWDRTLDRMIAICEANRFEEIHQYWDSPVNVPNEQHAWLFLDGGIEIYASPCLWPGDETPGVYLRGFWALRWMLGELGLRPPRRLKGEWQVPSRRLLEERVALFRKPLDVATSRSWVEAQKERFAACLPFPGREEREGAGESGAGS